ncbi:AAA family ATPase [Aliamphritea spongicola]|nr:AAA family ATPase [Aliamphritea spongicola]
MDEWPKVLRKEFRLLFNALESDCLRPQPAVETVPVVDDTPVTLDMFAEPPAPQVPAGFVSATSLSDRYSSMGEPGEEAPLIFDGERVYLQRYFSFEAYLNSQINRLAQPLDVDESSLKQGLAQLFKPDPAQTVDWQQVAVAVALRRRFSIISGGPGTGKTTTVTRLLALYIQQQCLQHGADFVPAIKLAAPTGKAAARLSESIAQARDQLNISPEIIQRIPVEATTIHRLLGTIPNSKSFRHNAENPLHLELLVVDEASMIDLPMMARLLAALPPQGRIILIGDKHQLASVEAGSVLGDICAWHLQAGNSQSVTSAELQYSADQAGYLSRVWFDARSVAGGGKQWPTVLRCYGTVTGLMLPAELVSWRRRSMPVMPRRLSRC